MATQTVSHLTAAAFKQIGVQRLEALEHWDWYEEVPARIADKPFDLALVVAFARSAKPILEQVVRRQRSLDRTGGLKKGEFLAHRNVHRSEDETANSIIEGAG